MKKKYANTLVALAVLAALGAGLTYWERRKSREPSKSETTPQEKLLTLEEGRIQAFTIELSGGESVSCRREGGKWVISEPKRLDADQSAIDALLRNVTDLTIDQVASSTPADLKDFGLDAPSLTLEVATDVQPPNATVLIGDETPTGSGVYAQLAGNPRVVILPRYLKSSFEKKLFDLRDRRVVTLDVDQLQRIHVESKGKRWTLVKNPEGAWNLDLPPLLRVDRFTVNGMADRLRNAAMQSIVAEEKRALGRYGLNVPELRLEVSAPAGSQTLVLGKKEGERYFAINSALQPVFTIDSSFLNTFDKDADDLRAKELFSFSNFEVKQVEVQTPEGSRVFESQPENKWKQTVPAAKDVDREKLETLLNRLHGLRAQSFPKGKDLAAFGLNKPAYRFKVRFGEKNEEEVVEAAKVASHVYARRATDALPCEVESSTLDEVEKALKEL